MRTDWYTKTVLTLIAALLAAIAFRAMMIPVPAQAAQGDTADLYIEPGYTSLRKPDGTAQLIGKMVVNRRTGEIWGFPTLADSPYPINTVNSEPPVSSPMYLGKFDFSKVKH
jgi:hypothetical protein